MSNLKFLKVAIAAVTAAVLLLCPVTALGSGDPAATDPTIPTDPPVVYEKTICTASIDDDFAPDDILIMLSNAESLKLKDYTASDFADVSAISVKDLSSFTVASIKAQRLNPSVPPLPDGTYIDESRFHRNLCITLGIKDKQNVLDCIKILEKRDEVLYAGPNTIMYPGETDTYLYGDADMDGRITVKDATAIQKHVADIKRLTAVPRFLADMSGAGITVKAATDIQQFAAGLKLNDISVGEGVIMSTTDKFSSGITDPDGYFANDCIMVLPNKGIGNDYTIDDFPEYEFESISITEASSADRYTRIKLMLKNPGKENVIKAIKALDYRANLDLYSVSPNSFAVPGIEHM